MTYEPVAGPSHVAERITPTDNLILKSDLHNATTDLEQLQKDVEYLSCSYSVSSLKENVLLKETGLPTRELFGSL